MSAQCCNPGIKSWLWRPECKYYILFIYFFVYISTVFSIFFPVIYLRNISIYCLLIFLSQVFKKFLFRVSSSWNNANRSNRQTQTLPVNPTPAYFSPHKAQPRCSWSRLLLVCGSLIFFIWPTESLQRGQSVVDYTWEVLLALKEAQITSALIPWARDQSHSTRNCKEKSGRTVKLFACEGEKGPAYQPCRRWRRAPLTWGGLGRLHSSYFGWTLKLLAKLKWEVRYCISPVPLLVSTSIDIATQKTLPRRQMRQATTKLLWELNLT